MAGAVADGARSVAGTEVTIKRVPELVPEDVAKKSGFKLDQKAPIAKPEELADYRSEEHTSELQSLMRISYAVFCLKKKKHNKVISKQITTIEQSQQPTE